MTYRVRNIVIAVVLAALAALLTSFYVTNYKRQVQQSEDLEKIYVASEDIPAGTSGAEAARRMEVKQVANRAVVPGAVSDPSEIQGLIVAQPVFAGEQVTVRRFSSVSRQGIHGQLKGNQRAVQVQGTAQQMLAGTIRPGDHVDVVASFTGDNSVEATRIVLRDIEVLKTNGGGALGGPKLSSGLQDRFQVILKLTDAQENKLQFATTFADDQTGDEPWSLVLRPPVEDSDSPESLETLRSLLRDGLGAGQAAKLALLFGSSSNNGG